MPFPDFSFEKTYWEKGFETVIGVDEVGRGAFAGPVVAGAASLKCFNNGMVQFSDEMEITLDTILKLGINDSKKLTAKKREDLAKIIPTFFHYSIGEASVTEINTFGIVQATEKAMRRAIRIVTMTQCSNGSIIRSHTQSKKFLLVDGFKVKHISGFGLKGQLGVIRGDSQSVSIAAASIMAKVYRDKHMEESGKKFAEYDWGQNKGYGTKFHREAIKSIGISSYHRYLFVRNWLT